MARSALIKAIFNLKFKIKIDWSAEFSANRMCAFHHARRTERDGRNGRRTTRTMESIPAAQAWCSVDLATQTSGTRGNFVRTNVGSGKKCRYKRYDIATWRHYITTGQTTALLRSTQTTNVGQEETGESIIGVNHYGFINALHLFHPRVFRWNLMYLESNTGNPMFDSKCRFHIMWYEEGEKNNFLLSAPCVTAVENLPLSPWGANNKKNEQCPVKGIRYHDMRADLTLSLPSSKSTFSQPLKRNV